MSIDFVLVTLHFLMYQIHQFVEKDLTKYFNRHHTTGPKLTERPQYTSISHCPLTNSSEGSSEVLTISTITKSVEGI